MTDLRDQLCTLTKNARQKKLDEKKLEEQRLIEYWSEKDMYWNICERKLWPKIWEYMVQTAKEGGRDCTYCVTYKDFEGSEMVVTEIYTKHVIKLRECLVSYMRFKGFFAKGEYVMGHNNGGHTNISW
jgi:hypothetical protein